MALAEGTHLWLEKQPPESGRNRPERLRTWFSFLIEKNHLGDLQEMFPPLVEALWPIQAAGRGTPIPRPLESLVVQSWGFFIDLIGFVPSGGWGGSRLTSLAGYVVQEKREDAFVSSLQYLKQQAGEGSRMGLWAADLIEMVRNSSADISTAVSLGSSGDNTITDSTNAVLFLQTARSAWETRDPEKGRLIQNRMKTEIGPLVRQRIGGNANYHQGRIQGVLGFSTDDPSPLQQLVNWWWSQDA